MLPSLEFFPCDPPRALALYTSYSIVYKWACQSSKENLGRSAPLDRASRGALFGRVGCRHEKNMKAKTTSAETPRSQRAARPDAKHSGTKYRDATLVPRQPLDGKSRSTYVYEKLCDAISEGRFAPGTRLAEEEIARLFGVSRTPVREALQRLEARGLLAIGAGRSLVVAQLTLQQVLELYAMREILEGSAARFAAQHASEAEIALLRRLHKDFMEAWNQPERLVPLNRRFHQAIYEAAHNRYLGQALKELNDAFALLQSNTFRIPNRPRESNAEHLKIIDAIAERDPDRAERAAREHIQFAQRTRFERLPELRERGMPRSNANIR